MTPEAGPRSMLPFAPAPIDYNPYAGIERELADRRVMIEREIAQLQEILSRQFRETLRPDPAAPNEDAALD